MDGASINLVTPDGDRPLHRRIAEVSALWAVWLGLGFALPHDPNLYLLLGVPLTAVFQVVVRRRPLRALWIRESPAFHVDLAFAAIAIAVGIVPAWSLAAALGVGSWITAAWSACAVGGAFSAAYALRNADRRVVREGLLCIAIAGGVGTAVMVMSAAARILLKHDALHPHLLVGLRSLALYFAVSFWLEEVSFRGAMDAHLDQRAGFAGLPTAFFVSALWGLWHLPTLDPRTLHGPGNWLVVSGALVFVHTLVGVPLALFWRRSGNLAVTAFTHAFIDAVRNALMH